MLWFVLCLAALVVVNLLTDHEARREGLNEIGGGIHLGS